MTGVDVAEWLSMQSICVSVTDTHPFILDVMLILYIAILFCLGAGSFPGFYGGLDVHAQFGIQFSDLVPLAFW